MKTLTLLLSLLSASIALAEEPAELVDLRQAWEKQRTEAQNKVDKLYFEELEELKKNFTQAGKLAAALAVDNVIKGGKKADNEPAELSKMRQARDKSLKKALTPLDKKYWQDLKNLKQEFQADGNLNGALAADTEIKKVLAGQKTRNQKWRVIFRSSNPRLWNTETDNLEGFSRKLSSVSKNTKFLRMRNGHSVVIVPMTHEQLPKKVDLGGGITWNGAAYNDITKLKGVEYQSTVLGIGSSKWYRKYGDGNGGIVTVEKRDKNKRPQGLGGWGFGRGTVFYSAQHYFWEGKETQNKEFEISVSPYPLATIEAHLNLVK